MGPRRGRIQYDLVAFYDDVPDYSREVWKRVAYNRYQTLEAFGAAGQLPWAMGWLGIGMDDIVKEIELTLAPDLRLQIRCGCIIS